MSAAEKVREAREARGWSQSDLAKRVGVTQPAINKIETGGTLNSKFFPRIAQVLDLDLSDLIPDLNGPVANAPPAPAVIPEARLLGGRDFPIYASAMGGDGEIIRSSEPVDFMPRPAPVEHVRGAYGLIVTGTSMEPEFRSGDTAIINPHLPPQPGEAHIFYAEVHGEAKATIKHLRRVTTEFWQVTQWNPAEGAKKDFSLSRKEWPIAHRVLGRFSRR